MTMDAILEQLINLPTPGTREEAGQKFVIRHLRDLCDRVETDIFGSAVGVINAKAETRVLLTAHVDEVACMVESIDSRGYLRLSAIGRCQPDGLVGQRVHVHSEKGVVTGVVARAAGAPPKEELKIESLWIDIGASDREQALKRVSVGDTVTPQCGFNRLSSDLVAGRGLDDRAGVVAMIEALRLIKADRRKPKVAVYALSAVQEEGPSHRGIITQTFRIRPQAALAIDCCLSQDSPGQSGDIKLGGGPLTAVSMTTNRATVRRLQEAAGAARIPLTLIAEPRSTGTDADALASVGEGVATGVLYFPVRNLHSPSEVASLKDLQSVAQLTAEFVLRLPETPDFKPF